MNLEMTFTEFRDLIILCSNNEDPALDPLRKLLKSKLQRMVEHDLYTTFKTAKSKEERETARQRYLEEKGIPDSFRW